MPGVLDRLQKVLGKLTPERTPAQRVLIAMQEHIEEDRTVAFTPQRVRGVDGLFESADELQRDVLIEALDQLGSATAVFRGHADLYWYFLPHLINLLLARKLPFDAPTAARLLRGANHGNVLPRIGLGHVLKTIERLGPPLAPDVAKALESLQRSAQSLLRAKEFQKLAPRFAELLQKPPAELEAGGAFSEAIFAQLTGLPPEEAAAWRELFRLGVAFTGARPTAKWSAELRAVLARIGEPTFIARASAWLALGPTPGGEKDAYVPDTDTPFLRALVFAVGVAGASQLATEIGDFALACYRKIPNRGPVSQGAGNACLWTLGEVGLDGVGQLGKLKTRVKYAVALRLIEKALADAALRTGLSPEDLEEIGVPTFELDDRSRRDQALGDVIARIEVVDGREAKLTFVGPSGKAQLTPPATLKGTPELKALKARVKDLDAMLLAQRLRIERLFLTDRSWPFETWRARLLDHPLLQGIARRLIWAVGTAQSVTFREGRLVDAAGAVAQPAPSDSIALWHPLDRPAAERDAWEAAGVETPFKQVDRETYSLDPGQAETGRFAGRRIAQHKFHALCRERGWSYRLQGEFDSINDAVLTLPKWGLTAALEVAPPHATGTSASAIYLEVETGELRFTFDRKVPPRVLSEVMRDVALFVEE